MCDLDCLHCRRADCNDGEITRAEVMAIEARDAEIRRDVRRVEKCDSAYYKYPDAFAKYEQTEAAKQRRRSYEQEDKAKARRKTYEQTEKAKERRRAYEQTDKAKERRRAYENSEKRKEYKRLYRLQLKEAKAV